MNIRLEKHWSMDRPTPYYYIYADTFALFSSASESDARDRLSLIKELGIKEYIERIRIQKEVLDELLLEEPVQE